MNFISSHKDKLSTLIIVIVYIGYRFWFFSSGRCLLDSDEAVFGIIALDLLKGEFHPFYLGQDYMGSFQAWVCAPWMLLVGPFPLALRLSAITLGVGTLFLWKGILHRFGKKELWPGFALLLALPPQFILTSSLMSRGTIELFFLGSLFLYFYVRIITANKKWEEMGKGWLALGFVTGISWWTNPLILLYWIPAVIHALCLPQIRKKLLSLKKKTYKELFTSLWISIYFLSLLCLLALGTAFHSSPLTLLLLKFRYPLLFLHFFLLGGYLLTYQHLKIPVWPLKFGGMTLLSYSPALVVYLSKDSFIQKVTAVDLQGWFTNYQSLLILSFGAFTGVIDPMNESPLLPLPLLGLVLSIYIISVLLIIWLILKPVLKKMKLPEGELLMVLLLVISFLALGPLLDFFTVTHRYAFTFTILLTFCIAWFFHRLSLMFKPLAVLLLTGLLVVNLRSSVHLPSEPMILSKGIQTVEGKLIDFLLDKNIHVAATSLQSISQGYSDAYKLSLASGEQLLVHPILHSPRVDRYRLELQKAKHCAIITILLEKSISDTFELHSIEHSKTKIGDWTVFWNFDKQKVDELQLISYAEKISLDLKN